MPDDFSKSISTDAVGRMILSNTLDIDAQANGLDVRPFDWAWDSAAVTVTNTDVRSLSGARDGAVITGRAFAEGSQSATVVALSSINMLTRDLSPYRKNTFLVRNTSGISVSVTVSLQIAPVDSNNYYINDGSSYSLLGGNIAVFQPTQLLRFARIRISALLALANITVYYFGQT